MKEKDGGTLFHCMKPDSENEVLEMNEVLKKIGAIGIVPVVKIDDAKDAAPLAKALCAGGLPCAEITFRTDAAEEAIRRMHEAHPEMLIGAGTVLTPEQADRAMAAGASFIVSPGFNPRVVKHCVEKGYPVTPGCANPSDVEQAIEMGLDVVKIFPAEQVGGLKMIKAIAAPYHDMMFMPTGGINAKNLNDYLSFNKILACGGSWMVKDDMIRAGAFDQIEALTREAVQTMLGFTIGHVGINCETAEEARRIAGVFEAMFGFTAKEGEGSLFAGTAVEVMKGKGPGRLGHIAIRTNFLARAVNYLTLKGYAFEDEKKYDEKGNWTAIYLKEEIGGFGVHLVQKK